MINRRRAFCCCLLLGAAGCASGGEIDRGESGATGTNGVGGDGAAANSGGGGAANTGGVGDGSTSGGAGGEGGVPIDCSGPSGWSQLGSALDAAVGDAYGPSLALGASGQPIVAWSEGEPQDVFVAGFDGTDFELHGGAQSDLPGSTFATGAVLAVGNGQQYVAWSESDGAQIHPRVKQWTGTDWVAVGGPLGDGPMFSFVISLVIDSVGDLYLAWNESDGTATNVRVAKYDGADWSDLGAPLSAVGGGSSALSPYLAINSRDQVSVVWQESSSIYVRAWSGSAWQEVGGGAVNAGAGIAFAPHAAFDHMDRFFVGFAESGSVATESHVRLFDGNGWLAVGGALDAVAGSGTNAVIDGFALDSGDHAVVAWSELGADGIADVFVHADGANGFQPVGAMPLEVRPGDTGALVPDVVVDACGRIVVAWAEESAIERDVIVWRFKP